MMRQQALKQSRSGRDSQLSQLSQLLSIPSISTLTQHKPHIQRMADWLANDLRHIGLENVQILPTAGNPVVYADWLHAPTAPTVLIYGHYDVQPADPLDLWQTDPFTPTLKDNAIYARGASDNKAQFFSHMKAVEAILAGCGTLPVNVKFVLDGEEEVGSPNIETFANTHKTLLAADYGLISDGAMPAFGQPVLEYGLRGIVMMDVVARGPGRDLHSGSFGGSVYNPAQFIAHLISQLHNPNGTIQIPGFYDNIPPLTPEERALLAQVPYPLAQWHTETGASQPWGEREYTFFERMVARPTCEVNGLWGGFAGEGAKTIIPNAAGAKISMRLVPNQDPHHIAQLFTDFVHTLTPPQIQLQVNTIASCWPALMPIDSPAIRSAQQASQTVWQKAPILSRGGGSLPVIAAFQRALNAPFVLMPFGLDDNRHAPNEHYLLDNFYKGIETAIHFHFNLANAT